MIHIKKLKKNEKVKLEAVSTVESSKELVLPYFIFGNYCITPQARCMVNGQRPNPEQIASLLKKWYQRTFSQYSEGIYSFMRRGRNRRTPDMPFYVYIKNEIDSILSETSWKDEYKELADFAGGMWEKGIEQYQDTFFWSYHLLHGDLHMGNIVAFLDGYRFIDWENLRTGPKELEISFYLCWDYLSSTQYPNTLDNLMHEIDVFCSRQLIHEIERERILYCLIPMWMYLMVIHLNNGSLLFEEERKEACKKIIPLYENLIFSEFSQRKE